MFISNLIYSTGEKKSLWQENWNKIHDVKLNCSLAQRLKNRWAALGLLTMKILEKSSKFAGEKEKNLFQVYVRVLYVL